jgi:hypothetical protein
MRLETAVLKHAEEYRAVKAVRWKRLYSLSLGARTSSRSSQYCQSMHRLQWPLAAYMTPSHAGLRMEELDTSPPLQPVPECIVRRSKTVRKCAHGFQKLAAD